MTTDEAVIQADALRAYRAIRTAADLAADVGKQFADAGDAGEVSRWTMILAHLDRAQISLKHAVGRS
jgi:hypothetical protein